MRVPAAAELLDLWDAGQTGTPMQRTLLLLRAACDGEAAIEQRALGYVNARLLELRLLLFGRHIECLANCPRCDAIAETRIDVEAMLAYELPHAVDEARVATIGAEAVVFRLPTAADLVELGRGGDADGKRLLARIAPCQSATASTHEIAAEIARCLAAADPLAHIELVLQCPECGNEWSEPCYVVDLLWSEIGSVALRTIRDVARLAHAFGWSEADVLEMTPQRRQRYLDWLPA